MKKKWRLRAAALWIAASLCGSVAAKASAFEIYELSEGPASASGYIPAADPAEQMDDAAGYSAEPISLGEIYLGRSIKKSESAEESGADAFSDGDSESVISGTENPAGAEEEEIGSFDAGEAGADPYEGQSPAENGNIDTFSALESQEPLFEDIDIFPQEEDIFFDGGTEETVPFPEESQTENAVFSDSAELFEDGSDFGEPILDETEAILYGSAGLPSSYSLVQAGFGSPVENQGSLGICWAFSSLESAETGLMHKGLASQGLNLSETHLSYSAFHGTNQDADDPTAAETFLPNGVRWTRLGGNKYYAAATLARGYGAAYEADFPLSLVFEADLKDYPGSKVSLLDTIITDAQKKTSVSRLRNSYWLLDINTASTPEDRVKRVNAVKSFIYNYGAVEMGIRVNGYKAPYDKATNSFYTSAQETDKTPNHSVALVGWDDAKETKAAVPGAFLIQNSWGSDSGENGLFWLSYEDCSMKSPAFYEMENEPVGAVKDRIVYQYDGTGYNSVIKPSNPSDSLRISGANVFQAKEAQYLTQVGFYAGASSLPYTIRIYRYVSAAPDTGYPVLTQSGFNSYAGYYTIDLEKPVPLAAGEKFAVQLTFDHKNGYVPHEKGTAAYRQYTADYGQSYLFDGNQWIDMMEASDGSGEKYACNICIKASGERTNDPITLLPPTPGFSAKIESGYNLSLSITQTDGIITGYDYAVGKTPDFLSTGEFVKEKLRTADPSASFTCLSQGTYYMAVRAYRTDKNGTTTDGNWSPVTSVTITADPKPAALSLSVSVKSYDQLTISLKNPPSDIVGYNYVVGKTANFLTTRKFVQQKLGTKSTSVTFSSLPKGTYYVAARAYRRNEAGKQVLGYWSKAVSVKITVNVPKTPSFSSVKTANGNRISATAKKPSSTVDAYVFALGKASNFTKAGKYYKKITVKGAQKAVFDYIPKGTYYAAVRAYNIAPGNKAVYSSWSAVKKITITAVTPGTPKFSKVTPGKGTLTAVYTKASGADQYEYVLSKKKFAAADYSPASRYATYTGRPYRKVNIKKMKAGTYYLGVRGYTMSGKTKVYGKWVVKKITIR